MKSEGFFSEQSPVKLNFIEIVPSTEEFKSAITTGVTKTWARCMSGSVNFDVEICSFLTLNDGTKIALSAQFIPRERKFQFAQQTISERIHTGLSLEDNALLIAAHETFHAVQSARGEKLTPFLSNPNYKNDPHEKEAWEEAIITFKEVYPNASGYLKLEGITLHI